MRNEEDDPDDVPEGFHLQEESPHCINMHEGGQLPSLPETDSYLEFETIDQKQERHGHDERELR